jgi:hypothetical protein
VPAGQLRAIHPIASFQNVVQAFTLKPPARQVRWSVARRSLKAMLIQTFRPAVEKPLWIAACVRIPERRLGNDDLPEQPCFDAEPMIMFTDRREHLLHEQMRLTEKSPTLNNANPK